MRRKSMVLIVIAAGCGLVASIGISQVLDKQAADQADAPEMVEIYVTNTHVNNGEVLTPQMVSLEGWPKDRIPEGAISEWELMENRRPNSPLVKGMPILESMLVDPNNRNGAADRIPLGYRALPVKVTSDMTSGLVQPGDMVDVLVVLRQAGQITKTIAKTILQNVRVFAINEHIVRERNGDGAVIEAKTVTLQVTPQQVEVLTLASRMGDLTLSIRPPADPLMVSNEGLDMEGLLGSSEISEKVEDKNRSQDKRGDGGFADFVRSQGQPNLAEMAAAMPVDRGPTMVIVEPEGERWYQFGPNGERPQQVTPFDSQAGSAEPPAGMGADMAGDEDFEPLDVGTDDEQPVDDGDGTPGDFSLDKIGL